MNTIAPSLTAICLPVLPAEGAVCDLQRVIRAYAAKLVGRLPKTATGLTSGTPTAHMTDWCGT